MGQVVKVAISIPREKYQRAEQLRKRTGRSRSALYAEALDGLFAALAIRELEAQYAAGYRAHPENDAEIEELLKSSSAVLGKEKW
jgi:predicted DNA-binding protein